jgi:hypothetical protein
MTCCMSPFWHLEVDPRVFRKLVDLFKRQTVTQIFIFHIRRRWMITFTLLPIYLQGKRSQHEWLEQRGTMGVLKKIRVNYPCQESKHGSRREIRSLECWKVKTCFFTRRSKFIIHSYIPIPNYIPVIQVCNTASLNKLRSYSLKYYCIDRNIPISCSRVSYQNAMQN